MVKAILWSILSILYLASIYLCTMFFTGGNLLIGIISLIIIVGTGIIFINPKAYPFRFMYPGLLTFALFMVIPIIFTIYISFTNLSTGHFLSQRQVQEILTNEIHIADSSEKIQNSFSYNIYKNSSTKNYLIEVDKKFVGNFFLTDRPQNITLLEKSAEIDLKSNSPLSLGDVYDLKKEFSTIDFILPNGTIVKYFRTNLLAPIVYRYVQIENDQLKDVVTNTIFTPDYKTGFYSSNNKNHLVPGFYVSVGINNFKALLSDQGLQGPFIKIFLWTFLWALLSVFTSFSLGMLLALIVNSKKLAGRAIYRVLLIIPYSIPFFISMLVFKGMLNKDFGVINELLEMVGISDKINWLGNPIWAKVSCLMVNLWLGFPYMFLVTTGILQSVPESVYEAAKMDGAQRFATFRFITLPMIFSAIAPFLVGTFAFNFNNFVGIYLLTAGGPPIVGATTAAGETDILISYTYKLAFEGGMGQNFGLASTIAILIFFIITAVTLINFKLSGIFKEERR